MPTEGPIDYITVVPIIVGYFMIVVLTFFYDDRPRHALRWYILGILGGIAIDAIGALIYG